MNEFLAKISSYDIFNNLVPGAVLAVLLSQLEIYTVDTKNIAVDLIVFYFMGIVASRIGSLIVEPTLKFTGFIHYAKYVDFIAASKADEKIQVLLEVNNQHRTFASVMLITFVSYLGHALIEYFGISEKIVLITLVLLLTALFLMAFHKQTNFIRKRVEHNCSQR